MRFLLDQSTDARLIPYLTTLGHDTTRVGRDYPAGLADAQVLALAVAEQRILITDDRDFGELVFPLGQPHAGVIDRRLGADADLPSKIARLDAILTHYADRLGHFLVVTRRQVRVRQRHSTERHHRARCSGGTRRPGAHHLGGRWPRTSPTVSC